MERLIEMRTTPIKLEFQTQNARYEMRNPTPSVEITRQRGGLQIKSKHVQVKLDTYDARSSMGFKNVFDSVAEFGQRGMQAAQEATANFAEEGNMLADIHQGDQAFSQIASQRGLSELDTMLGFTPAVPVQISWDPHELQMQYERDRLQFDWRTHHQVSDWQFIPGKLEYRVTQYPKVEFTYVGEPVYVPPSSSPNYEPPFNVMV